MVTTGRAFACITLVLMVKLLLCSPTASPIQTCTAPLLCIQRAFNISLDPAVVLCASEECLQDMNYTNVDKMQATAVRVSQSYKNPSYKLNEMQCVGYNGSGLDITAGPSNVSAVGTSFYGLTPNNSRNLTASDISCNQNCNWCGNTSCKAVNCKTECSNCEKLLCESNKTCIATCNKQCNSTFCNSDTCNMTCMSNSQCPSVVCGNTTNNCNLNCRDRATCDLNCTLARNCVHSCALSGICYTRIGAFVDLHNGQCGNCNCTKDVRNCVQRCEGSGRRCLELFCDASEECDQHSASTSNSFVYRMRSYAPTTKQTCSNGSSCWQMVCYGKHCNISCSGGAQCDYMICQATTCVFNCRNGSRCDYMKCLKDSQSCSYNCDATSTCRIKRCEGAVCIGAPRYIQSGADMLRISCFLVFLSLFVMLVRLFE